MNLPKFTLKKILILVTILAVPGFLYFLLQEKGKNRYKPLGFYGPKSVASTFHTKRGKKIPDTVYHQVRPFTLQDEEGQAYTFPEDSAKITVVNFFFSRCTSVCPQMHKQIARIYKEYETNRLMKFLSISVDPTFDQPEVLAKYAAAYRPAEKNRWTFLTGDSSKIYQISKTDFLVDAFRDTARTVNFIHSPMLMLLDPERRIRGYYDSGSKEQVDRLNDEIKVLITEELRKFKVE